MVEDTIFDLEKIRNFSETAKKFPFSFHYFIVFCIFAPLFLHESKRVMCKVIYFLLFLVLGLHVQAQSVSQIKADDS